MTMLMWVFPKKSGFYTPNHEFYCNRGFPLYYKPSILGGKHPYFWFNTHVDDDDDDDDDLSMIKVSNCYFGFVLASDESLAEALGVWH